MDRKWMLLPTQVREVENILSQVGGKVMVVGGAVIDLVRGVCSADTDWDLEVYGLTLDQIKDALQNFNPTICGASFGVVRISVDGCDIDVSIPRKDNSTGVGHKDFHVQTDPEMDPVNAAGRRDFTINSMFYDIENMKVVDPYGGLDDLAVGEIRMVSTSAFKEDPLRVLRAMQLVARKGNYVDLNTIIAARGMDMDSLPRERVMGEWVKLLLKADRPSLGLRFLLQCGWLRYFPELVEFVRWSGWDYPENISITRRATVPNTERGCPQNPDWHPEGNVWIHTLKVVDAAARVRHKVPEEWRLAFMFAALLHDVAKPITTILPECTAHGHEAKGGPLARRFMGRLTDEKELIENIVTLVTNHLQPYNLSRGAKPNAWKRLQGKVRLDVLGWLSRADWAGRPGRDPLPGGGSVPAANCFWWHEKLGAEPIKPVVNGRDLIAEGYEPGPHFKVGLDAAFDAQLENDSLSREALTFVAIKALLVDRTEGKR